MSGIGDRDIERLESLANLRDRGALTDAEFEAEKAKILNADSAGTVGGGGGAVAIPATGTAGACDAPTDQLTVSPRRGRGWRLPVVITTVVFLWVAFMVATAGTAVIPSIQKWAGPVLCHQPYGKMVIHSQSGSYMPGESYTNYSEACANARGAERPINGLADRAVVLVETFLGLVVLAVVLIVLLAGLSRFGGAESQRANT
jgi:hypothetical protein